jgi:Protein of unknown function (DUF1761)
MSLLPYIVAAFVPMLIGFVWYSDKAFGPAWQKAANLTIDKSKTGNLPVILLTSLFFSFLLSLALSQLVIHQNALPGLFNVGGKDPSPESPEGQFLKTFKDNYGMLHRTFTHGVVHGIIYSILFVLPIVGINALFESRGWKYIMIHFGYWLITLALMGGIICAWVV